MSDDPMVLYRSMPVSDLTTLRAAFALDREAALERQAADTVAFCDGRIDLLDAELARRAEAGPSVHDWADPDDSNV